MLTRTKTILLFLCLVFLNNCVHQKGHQSDVRNSPIFKSKEGEQAYLTAYNNTLALWPVPYEEINIKTTLGTAHVIVSGPETGPTLVLLHGLNASSTMWYPNSAAFSEKYRTYAIDLLLEPGKSVPEGKINGKEDLVKWYNEIFDHFGFKEVFLIGASRGGWIAINLALNSNGRIKKIVLLSPAQTFSSIKPKRKILTNVFYAIHPERKNLREVLQTMSFNVDQIKQPFIDQFYIGSKERKRNRGLRKMKTFSDNDLRSLRIPILLLIGDHDIINKEKSLEKAKSLIPDLESGIIQNAGHLLSLDQSDVVNKRIMDFLSGNK